MMISFMPEIFHTEIYIALIKKFAVQIVQKFDTDFAQN